MRCRQQGARLALAQRESCRGCGRSLCLLVFCVFPVLVQHWMCIHFVTRQSSSCFKERCKNWLSYSRQILPWGMVWHFLDILVASRAGCPSLLAGRAHDCPFAGLWPRVGGWGGCVSPSCVSLGAIAGGQATRPHSRGSGFVEAWIWIWTSGGTCCRRS